MGSLIPAAWSFMLAARSRGLGSCWTNLHLLLAEEADKVLGLPAGVMQVALIPTAYTIGLEFRPAHCRPLDEILHPDRW
jgi:nitroreductase